MNTDFSRPARTDARSEALANLCFRAALTFFGIGVAMGTFMSLTHDFTIRPVHVHVNLIGFVGFFIYGAFYRFFPASAATRLARAQVVCALVGLPPMMTGLALLVFGQESLGIPLLLGGEAVTVASVVMFLIVGFRATGRPERIVAGDLARAA